MVVGKYASVENLLEAWKEFLQNKLKLELHPGKIFLETLFHKILRTATKKRIFKKLRSRHKSLFEGIISEESFNQSSQSYLGMLKHCSGNGIKKEIIKILNQ